MGALHHRLGATHRKVITGRTGGDMTRTVVEMTGETGLATERREEGKREEEIAMGVVMKTERRKINRKVHCHRNRGINSSSRRTSTRRLQRNWRTSYLS